MGDSRAKVNIRRLIQIALCVAVLSCMGFVAFSTGQLNHSIDQGNRKIVLNYAGQVAARLHDLFERVDISLAELSRELVALPDDSVEAIRACLGEYEATWALDASGIMYENGVNRLSDGSTMVFENEVSLRDVLSYSQKLNVSRQRIEGEDVLVLAKPCQRMVDGRMTSGVFAALKLERINATLGDGGYGDDSFLVLTQSNGDNIWRRGYPSAVGVANCFDELSALSINQGDSVLQMKTRMAVAMEGTIAYTGVEQAFYLAYVPLNVNYWYLLVSVRTEAIDLTELARQHFIMSALMIAIIVVMGGVSILYLTQRNKSIMRYNQQLEVATAMASEADKANQANKAKQAFLAKISHDIRTPLNGVIGMLTLAKEEYEDKQQCMERMDKATVSARYLLGLLNDVLDMSAIESGKLQLVNETVDLKGLLSEVQVILETSTREKGIAFTMDDSALTHRYFHGDSLRLKQVLMNLGSNAVKYTHAGGKIDLVVDEKEIGNHFQVCFRVMDNGEGIAEDKLDTIFQPFEQATAKRVGGVGLGLSIVKSFVELMGGQIGVESQLGKGSTFTVTLPMEKAEPPKSQKQMNPSEHLKDVSILLAEDNDINAEIAIALLSSRGAKVTLAHDGQEAVDAFRSAPKGTYQAILMDIQMPNMDGLEATRLIRQTQREDAIHIPILSMTANAFQEQKEEMIEAGMDDFLYKPIDIGTVCSVIRQWVGRDESETLG